MQNVQKIYIPCLLFTFSSIACHTTNHLHKGIEFHDSGQLESALSEYFDALDNTSHPQIHYQIGLALYELNQPNAALPHFSKARKQNYKHQKSAQFEALCLIKLRRVNSASALLRTVANRSADLNVTLAEALLASGDISGAKQAYSDALAQSPMHPQALLQLAQLNDQVLHNHQEATKIYEIYLSIAENTAQTEEIRQRQRYLQLTTITSQQRSEFKNQVWLYYQFGRFNEIVRSLKDKISKNAQENYLLGLSFLHLQKFPEALHALGQAVRQAPDDGLYLYDYLQVLKSSNKTGQYKKWLIIAQKQFPDEPRFMEKAQ